MTTAIPPGTLADLVEPTLPEAVGIRHDLHRHPELGYEETRTAEVIARRLSELGVEHHTDLAGGTGVLGFIPATAGGTEVPTVALRADIDALPIHEQSGAAHTSTIPGRMHACGHDGHTAGLLAAAHAIASATDRPNHTLLLFQPAEEGGAGAKRMIEDGALDGSRLGAKADAVFGLHGWPDLELGHTATRPGPLLAAADQFRITVKGRGGHAAFPHLAADPVLAAAHITTALQHIASRRVSPVDSVVVTVASIKAGEAHNVIPGEAHLKGTVRTLLPETRTLAEVELRRTAESIAGAMDATAEVRWDQGYPATINHPGAAEHFLDAARTELGNERVHTLPTPFMGGEDFAFYGEVAPACFFIVGLRPPDQHTYPGLHTPQFDFNDDALKIGVTLFARLALTPLPNLANDARGTPTGA